MPTATQSRQKRSTTRRKVARPRRPRKPSKPLRMSSPEAQRTLIDEIDDRQEALLNDLTALNARVEALLNDCLAAREEQRLAEEADTGEGAVTTPAETKSQDGFRRQDQATSGTTLAGPNVLISQSPAAASTPQEC
ncbi:MAG TPA: hypothetical protein P5307_23875 [Pirellulaceae bacterium]|nr:hypothetical protein [Planctomycetales bacterium]HRX82135.1 hypothetical protein [Pirellulaceae bacterium]